MTVFGSIQLVFRKSGVLRTVNELSSLLVILRMRVYITVFLRNRKIEFHFHYLFSISTKLENDIRTSSFVFRFVSVSIFLFQLLLTHSKNGIRSFGFSNEISNSIFPICCTRIVQAAYSNTTPPLFRTCCELSYQLSNCLI